MGLALVGAKTVTPKALEELTRDALEATAVLDDSRELEPFLFRVLDALKRNTGLRDFAAPMFIAELECYRTFVADLLAYCMHELRWPEIQRRVTELMQPEDTERWRRKSMEYRYVLASYEDDWSSRDLYAYYDEGVPPVLSSSAREAVPRGKTVRIDFDDLVVHVYGGDGKTAHRPLSELTPESRHVHGRLTICIGGRTVPGLGYWGPSDVCMVDWLAEMRSVLQAFESDDVGQHAFDEGEQGQPSFVFRRMRDRGFFTIADSAISDGVADPDWQDVEFVAGDLALEVRLLLARWLYELRAGAPRVADAWMDRWL